MEYLSHPDKLLRKHLSNVCNIGIKKLESLDIDYEKLDNRLDKDTFKKLMSIVLLSHDVGKYSLFFQYYIRKENELIIPSELLLIKDIYKQKLKNHSLLSGIVLYTILKESEFKNNIKLIDMAISALIQHHSNLKNQNYFLDYNYSDIEYIKKTLDYIDFEEYIEILKEYNIYYGFDNISLKENIENNINTYIKYLKKKKGINNKNEKSKNIFKRLSSHERNPFSDLDKVKFKETDFLLQIFIFSILIYSDKNEVILSNNVNNNFINLKGFVDKYKIYKNFNYENELDRQRQEIYKTVNNFKEENNKLFTLTMNTGFGKTLTSFNMAANLQTKLKEKTGVDYKIIYLMPLTSIIEQNFDVIEEILKVNLNVDNITSDLLLKHHYLSKKEYTNEEDIVFNEDECNFLYNTWESQIVFSTFVQFFESIFTNKNKKLQKFINIINSIIVIDESQLIPPDLYYVFRDYADMLSNIFNIYIINMSATQPYSSEENFGVSVLPNYKDYYKTDRTKIIINDSLYNSKYLKEKALKREEFIEQCRGLIEESSNKNMLVVLNTKELAEYTYDNLKEENKRIFLLSNNLIPLHKKEKIQDIKDLMDKKIKDIIVVSTQLIEAGVDLDFDIGLRDFATLPSLIQVVGRINRNFKHPDNYGELYVYNIENKSIRIYDENLLQYTFNVLREFNQQIIFEKDYLKLTEKYFDKISRLYKRNEDILMNYKNMLFSKINYKLIDNDYEEINVFIEYDENATILWNRFIELPYGGLERKKGFEEIQSNFLNYVIKVNKQKFIKVMNKYTNDIHLNKDYFKIKKDVIHQFYSKEKGFYLIEEGIKDNTLFAL